MKKMIMVVDDRSGEILADVEVSKLGSWFTKNRMVVVEPSSRGELETKGGGGTSKSDIAMPRG